MKRFIQWSMLWNFFLLLCLFIMADPRPFIFKRKRGNNIEIQIMNFPLSPEILENHSHKMMKIIHFFRFLSMFVCINVLVTHFLHINNGNDLILWVWLLRINLLNFFFGPLHSHPHTHTSPTIEKKSIRAMKIINYDEDLTLMFIIYLNLIQYFGRIYLSVSVILSVIRY